MSILVNYDPERNIFIGATTRISNISEATALSGLIVIFQNLLDTTIRLNEKLKSLCDGSLKTKTEAEIKMSSAIADVWTFIDGIRRLGLLYNFLPKESPQNLTDLVEEIKKVRDSFHHIDERISEHFNLIGGSIYGDLKWRYRANKDEAELLCMMISSAHTVTRESQNRQMGQVEDERFKNRIGIYDVQLIHIGKKNRRDPLNQVIINLDEAVDVINEVVLELENHYSDLIRTIGDRNIRSRSHPQVVIVRITEDAFKKIKR